MFFAERADAGRRLAPRLEYLRGEPVVMLSLPRGGVPVDGLVCEVDASSPGKPASRACAAAQENSLTERS
jgi:hypothetical protein